MEYYSTRFHNLQGMGSFRDADCIRIAIVEHRGKGEIVLLLKKDVGDVPLLLS